MRRADNVTSVKTCRTLARTALKQYSMPLFAVELLWNRFCNRTMGAEGSWVECTEELQEEFEKWLNEEV